MSVAGFVVTDRRDDTPLFFRTWADWRSHITRAPLPPAPLTEFCGYCWGQAKVYEPAPNGEGLVRRPCPECADTP